ncbi:MAG: TonB-dependent receptor plug domain-containing protein, partial [Bacteroidales bacterium]|nr:TonB-dependent receptor plug domain-containing protein [Bacteroidales bacterium]
MNSFSKVFILFIILFANISFSQESKTPISKDSIASISKNDRIYHLSHGELISDSLMLRGNIYDPLFLIKGLVAGASISKKGSQPGIPHEMVIRGLSSVQFTNKPIYIIDGVINADISLIHPSDIASIEILNNISHTAQYGNLGGNGIVIVKTKDSQGENLLHLEYDNFISFDQVARKHELLSASQFRTAQLEYEDPIFPHPLFYDAGADIDYQNELFRNAISHSHHFTASGKIKNTKYLASVSYKNQDGAIQESGASLINGNFKISQALLENKLQIQAGVNISTQNINGIDEFDSQDVLYQTYIHHPTDPVFHPDGSYYTVPREFRYYNPVEMIHSISNTITNNQFLSHLNIDYKPTENWNIHINGNYRKYNTESEFY